MGTNGTEFDANRTGLILIIGVTFGAVIGYIVDDVSTWIAIGFMFAIVAAVLSNRGMFE